MKDFETKLILQESRSPRQSLVAASPCPAAALLSGLLSWNQHVRSRWIPCSEIPAQDPQRQPPPGLDRKSPEGGGPPRQGEA